MIQILSDGTVPIRSPQEKDFGELPKLTPEQQKNYDEAMQKFLQFTRDKGELRRD